MEQKMIEEINEKLGQLYLVVEMLSVKVESYDQELRGFVEGMVRTAIEEQLKDVRKIAKQLDKIEGTVWENLKDQKIL